MQAAGDRRRPAYSSSTLRCVSPPVTLLLSHSLPAGLGAFDEDSPRSLHMLGMHGSVYANYAMQNADLIIALGARFDDRVRNAAAARALHACACGTSLLTPPSVTTITLWPCSFLSIRRRLAR